jgi:nitroimidazol reductase NimA-like FMN-containing flavoprotein (pyridoxamine 5'-phosphate oxidase superfamily)
MGAVTWREIASRLDAAHIYWLNTTNVSGAPDASPVWGVVAENTMYFYSERSTIKARNIGQDPRIVVHLESGSDVVIVHGKAIDIGHPIEHREIVLHFERKYCHPDEVCFLPLTDPCFDVMYRLEPARALAWALPDTEASTVRWKAQKR